MNVLKRIWLLVSGDLPPADNDDHEIARRAYADFLSAQLIGYAPVGSEALSQMLGSPSDQQEDQRRVPFPVLMGVETRMLDLLSDERIEQSYWIVRDRMNRVGGASGIAEHNKRLPESLREDMPAAPSSPIEVARAEKTAALASLGEAAVALATKEAELSAIGPAPTAAQLEELEAAKKGHADAVEAAEIAINRVAELEELARNEDDADGDKAEIKSDEIREADEEETVSPPAVDTDATPQIDEAALEHVAVEAEATERLNVATELADAEAGEDTNEAAGEASGAVQTGAAENTESEPQIDEAALEHAAVEAEATERLGAATELAQTEPSTETNEDAGETAGAIQMAAATDTESEPQIDEVAMRQAADESEATSRLRIATELAKSEDS